MTCINPACKGSPVHRPEHSTWTARTYYCPAPNCGIRFTIPTLAGQLLGLAPAILATCATVGVGMELNHSTDPDPTSWTDLGGGGSF
jgi:hypothetical protein